ncbi:RNA-directed DNA polymerase, eukaryota, reverse transcriptase zinc-binding domain protein [Tanacetum coccineum]|uniref:RNA-directed DNA polymerase, eukaryota, reverse transcriptase zinc-binding domain protein n=1 Tax=Tanacetum coccineum TaxID=301880 RepID=A0ABQ5CQZ1_9ASTR
MSTIRHNGKRQIKVPIKLVDSDYGTMNAKSKRNNKKKNLKDNNGENKNVGNEIDEVLVENVDCQSMNGEESNLSGKATEEKESEMEAVNGCVDKNESNDSNVQMNSGNKEHEEGIQSSVVEESVEELLSNNGNHEQQGSSDNPIRRNIEEEAMNGGNKASYVNMARKYQSMVNNKLSHIPTVLNDAGNEVVIFDEEIVDEGRRKWELSPCGYFVGYKMYIQELNYHMFRMWGKYGLKKITSIRNGNYVFKFNNESGLLIENGIWIVNNKPMVVQKWDIDVDINKVEPDVLPIWVKLVNLPLEAWTTKGLSAIASRLGKPVIMDSVTTQMCNQGIGRLGYARVLIEVEAKKGLPEVIDIQYFDKENKESITKTVKVIYDWKPPMCSNCKVFGHLEEKCRLKSRKEEVEEILKGRVEVNGEEVRSKKNGGVGIQENKGPNVRSNNVLKRRNMRVVYRVVNKQKEQFAILQDEDEEISKKGPNDNWKKTIDKFVATREEPPLSVTGKWNADMVKYYKEQRSKVHDSCSMNMNYEDEIELDENDVFIDKSANAQFMTQNEVTKQNEVRKLIRNEKLSVCAVLETHMKKDKIDKVCNKVFGNWSWQHNLDMSKKGCRIIVGWNQDYVQCHLMQSTRQTMCYMVEILKSDTKFFCTFIYAANHERDRRELWNELCMYKSIIGDAEWAIMGDMNVTLNTNEHSEGMSYFTQDMREFQDCINEIEMEDLCSSGLQYTWTKNHSPSILICPGLMKKIHRSFRMANYVTDKREFGGIVKAEWEKCVKRHAMYQMVDKLKRLKPLLNKLNWKNGNLFTRVENLKEKLAATQTKIDKEPWNKKLREDEVHLLIEYLEASQDEEKLLCQKAKVEWLKEGDRNSAYFHKVLKGKLNRSKIHKVMGIDGTNYEKDQVGIQFAKHFENFLGNTLDVADMGDEDEQLFKKIDVQDADNMCIEVTNDEIKRALFDIDDNKAPGPDGFTSKNFKKSWEVIKDDFCKAIKEFFRTRKLFGEVNATLITLVPKMQTPLKVTDFRPIACCNVVYKSISKILTNRIKPVLNKLVNQNQSAFLPGRAITDNILLTQELLRGYNNSSGPKRCSLKIDIQKAYDTVSWSFLEKILHYFGFPSTMIQWIMVCISTPKFTICVNGEIFGYFKGGRGLRQGDPISPYIFSLVMEVLNLFLKDKIAKERNFKYHFGCQKLKITHLCFADDLLMLCHGDTTSVSTIKRALEKFSNVSGLHPNMGKSTMFCGSLNEEVRNQILNILPFQLGKLPVKYLGVPLMDKKIGVKDCKNLVDKVRQKLNDWKNKSLSYAGRGQLIASVLSSMQVYWGSVFQIPKTVVKEIESLFKGFLWCNGELTRGKARVAWKDVCLPKEQGGLGLKPLELSVWDAQSYDTDSWCWKTILSLRKLVESHVRFKIGNGRNIYKLSDIVDDKGWKWPEEWIGKYNFLKNKQVPKLAANPDHLMWVNGHGNMVKFNTNQVWAVVRNTGAIVQWDKLVWFSQCILRHTFILWLAIKGKLITQDKLIKWYPQKVVSCPFCSRIPDSHEHLFFQCQMVSNLWEIVKRRARIKTNANRWTDIIKDMTMIKNQNSIWCIIGKLCLAATVYVVWQERNGRIFNNDKKDNVMLSKVIFDDVRARLVTLKTKQSKAIKTTEEEWDINALNLGSRPFHPVLPNKILSLAMGGNLFDKDFSCANEGVVFISSEDETTIGLRGKMTRKCSYLGRALHSRVEWYLVYQGVGNVAKKLWSGEW